MMANNETQKVTLQTLSGPHKIVAPGGWKFNTTDIIVWARLMTLTRERRNKLKRVRDGYVLDGQIEILSIILANSLGMASYYWRKCASELADVKT